MEISLTTTEAKYLISAISNQVYRNNNKLNGLVIPDNARDMIIDMTTNLEDFRDRLITKMKVQDEKN